MMGTAKPFASLSSGLLARKGGARPAMRPQVFNSGASLDDLGWNDMGQGDLAAASHPPEPMPPVLAEREALAARIAEPEPVDSTPKPAPEPAPPLVEATPAEPVRGPAITPVAALRIGRESAEQTARGKAAFTLRLDGSRHLRLRLASALANRSAQALVADALDRFLHSMPEVEALAAQLPSQELPR